MFQEDCNYYIPSELQNAIDKADTINNQLLSININARSILAKLGQIDLLLKSTQGDFDILAVSETWESANNTHLLNIAGYRKISYARHFGKKVVM